MAIRRTISCVVALAVFGGLVAGCSQSAGTAASPAGPVTVTLLTHDSFAVDKTRLAAFEKQHNIKVQIQAAGDAGQLVSSAILAAGAPNGDVLFGVDNSLAPKAVAAHVFAPFKVSNLSQLAVQSTYSGMLTPIDYGDVCAVYDKKWFVSHNAVPPSSLTDLAQPLYKNLLVVEDPALSSPGTAFLDSTINKYGTDWQSYWTELKTNGVKVASSWTQAYDGDFTAGGGKGTRPIVVSYGTDAAADIVFAANPKPKSPRVGIMSDGCYRQVEFAGVLAGAAHPAAAQQVVEWMTSQAFQADIPNQMFMYPALTGVALPPVFAKWGRPIATAGELPQSQVAANQTTWLSTWGTVMGK
jgi:thiamine transport system substrate-binding protein